MRVATLCLILLSAGAAAGRAASPSTPSGTVLVERFLAREDETLASYSGTRCLEASNERFHETGTMQVKVSLTPEGGFQWSVLREQGSAYIRNKVFRQSLESERDLVGRGEPTRAALSLANYEMSFEPQVEENLVGTARLRLVPRRSDILLLRGSVLITDPEADLLEVRGQLSKTPSWWTTKVDVVRTYERVAGVRVPVAMSSTAQVRVAGRSHFKMRATFDQINGRITGPTAPEDYCSMGRQ